MQPNKFVTSKGTPVASITADEIRTVDRIAIENWGLSLRQMMEHAERNLTRLATRFDPAERVTVLAGSGGNGGGGLACARHLANRDLLNSVVVDRKPAEFEGAEGDQLTLLERMDVPIETILELLKTPHFPKPRSDWPTIVTILKSLNE